MSGQTFLTVRQRLRRAFDQLDAALGDLRVAHTEEGGHTRVVAIAITQTETARLWLVEAWSRSPFEEADTKDTIT